MFSGYRKVEENCFQRTGIFPIMHTLVIKAKLLAAELWLSVSLYKAFVQAMELNYRRFYDTNALLASLPWLFDDIENLRRFFGEDIWNYSVEGSRPTLAAFVKYMNEQGLTQREMSVEELFVSNIRKELTHYLRSIG